MHFLIFEPDRLFEEIILTLIPPHFASSAPQPAEYRPACLWSAERQELPSPQAVAQTHLVGGGVLNK